MQTQLDSLQTKIEEARGKLPENTRMSIDAVDWKNVILGMRESKGYTFEQLGDLETETELLLCGLLPPEDYPKELASRMGIPRAQADELVQEMNNLAFSRIREELIKRTKGENAFSEQHSQNKNDAQILRSAGIEILPDNRPINQAKPDLTRPELSAGVKSSGEAKSTPTITTSQMLAQKFSGSFQIPSTKTEYTVPNVSKPQNSDLVPKKPGVDPYRETPE